MRYNQQEKTIEVILEVFADDLESFLRTQTGIQGFDLKAKNDSTNAAIEQFARDHFQLHLDGTSTSFHWVGYRITANQVKLFFEYQDIGRNIITVKNTVFTTTLEGQENVVHLINNQSKQTKICTKSNSKALFDLSIL